MSPIWGAAIDGPEGTDEAKGWQGDPQPMTRERLAMIEVRQAIATSGSKGSPDAIERLLHHDLPALVAAYEAAARALKPLAALYDHREEWWPRMRDAADLNPLSSHAFLGDLRAAARIVREFEGEG